MTDNTLYGRMSEIRDLINRPRKQHILLQDDTLWTKLCDSMDAVEDTEEVLLDYLKEDLDNSDKGLQIYDILTTLIDQQKAVADLYGALKFPYTKNSLLENIRRICIDAMEEPARGRNNTTSNSIDIPDLIATQRQIFWKFLNSIIKNLRKEELDHRKKFEGKKLTLAFNSITYSFEKIFEAIFSKNSPHILLVHAHVDQILISVDEFKNGLKERQEPDGNISDIYENIDYTLNNIKAYFQKNETHIQEKDLYIFADFALRQVKELQEIARQIDEVYSQNKIYM